MRLLPLCFLFLLGCVSTSRSLPVQPSLEASVVALVNEAGAPTCAGVMTSRGLLTAAHCVSASHAWISTRQDGWGPREAMGRRWVRVLRVDTVRDLALLETVPGPVRGLRLRPVEAGESVVIMGHPVGLPFVTHRGIVSRGEREEEGRRYFLTDAGIVPGMSGGPVFDEYGDVVGIASFSVGYFLVPQAHLGGAVPVSAILEFLEE